MGLAIVAAPTEDPLTVPEFKVHQRIPETDVSENTLIQLYLDAALEQAEKDFRQQLCSATYDFTLDAFKDEIEIPKPPLQSVTSIKYLDSDGVEQTLSSSIYTVQTNVTPGRVRRAYGQSWPAARKVTDSITIRFVAGYGGAIAVPKLYREAIFLLASHWFENREPINIGNIVNTIPWTYDRIVQGSKVQEAF